MALHRLPHPLRELNLLHRFHFTPPASPARPVRFSSSSSSPTPVRVRFAPSPTGYLHLGGLRTALFNHLLARRLGGTWTLRIEDTDQSRYVEGAVESLLKTLAWAKLDFDEGPGKDGGRGPYFQSQRKHIYDRYLERLIESGRAYHCFCTPDRLAETRRLLQKSGNHSTYDRKCLAVSKEEVAERLARGETSIVRFKSSPEGLTQTDLVYDPIHYASMPIEDFVLRKSDGLPTYHFANVVDDHEMGITHVLRGEEWLPSTPKHLAMYAALGISPPHFAHMPLLVNPDRSKLSKRAGDVRVEDYINRGYEPEALLNFVALMGWSRQGTVSSPTPAPHDGDTSEVLTMRDLIDNFSIEGINKNRATMSAAKLDYLNRAHLQIKVAPGNKEARKEVATRLGVLLREKFPRSELLEVDYVGRVIATLKERIHTINDVPNLGAYFFVDPDLDSDGARQLYKTVPVEVYQAAISDTIGLVKALAEEGFDERKPEPILAALNTLCGKGHARSPKELMNSLRHALTGQKVGAGVPATIGTLGREQTLKRLGSALEWSGKNQAG